MVEMRRFELLMLPHLGLNQAPIPIRVHLHTGEGLVLQNPQIYESLLDSLTAYLRPLAWHSHPPSLSAICTPSQQWNGTVHPPDEHGESIYYALLLYSSKRSGPKCPCRPATPSPKDGVLLLHHILDSGSNALV